MVRVIFSSFPITALHEWGVRGSSGQSQSRRVRGSCFEVFDGRWLTKTTVSMATGGERWRMRPVAAVKNPLGSSQGQQTLTLFQNLVRRETHSAAGPSSNPPVMIPPGNIGR